MPFLLPRFARIGNSSDSGKSAWRAIKIGVSIANDSRESIRARIALRIARATKAPKAGNGKKKKWKTKWKPAPSWTGATMKMAKTNEFLREFSIILPFLGHFLPLLPLSNLGPVSILISIFFPFPAFSGFPCHTSPAWSLSSRWLSCSSACVLLKSHWEIKGRFRKRMVLANVPSFRFSFWGNMRTCPRSGFRSGGTSQCTLVPVFVPGKHPPKPPFWKPPFCQPQKIGKLRQTLANKEGIQGTDDLHKGGRGSYPRIITNQTKETPGLSSGKCYGPFLVAEPEPELFLHAFLFLLLFITMISSLSLNFQCLLIICFFASCIYCSFSYHCLIMLIILLICCCYHDYSFVFVLLIVSNLTCPIMFYHLLIFIILLILFWFYKYVSYFYRFCPFHVYVCVVVLTFSLFIIINHLLFVFFSCLFVLFFLSFYGCLLWFVYAILSFLLIFHCHCLSFVIVLFSVISSYYSS